MGSKNLGGTSPWCRRPPAPVPQGSARVVGVPAGRKPRCRRLRGGTGRRPCPVQRQVGGPFGPWTGEPPGHAALHLPGWMDRFVPDAASGCLVHQRALGTPCATRAWGSRISQPEGLRLDSRSHQPRMALPGSFSTRRWAEPFFRLWGMGHPVFRRWSGRRGAPYPARAASRMGRVRRANPWILRRPAGAAGHRGAASIGSPGGSAPSSVKKGACAPLLTSSTSGGSSRTLRGLRSGGPSARSPAILPAVGFCA